MGPVQHGITIEKNGVEITDEPFMFMAGKNLYDAVEEILRADSQQSLGSYTHVNVNNVMKPVAELRSISLREDVTVELLNKSKGGGR